MINEIKVTPIGGVGEVGSLNCMVYETADEAIVVDCGSMFPDTDTLGVDLIIPDFTYLRQIKKKIKALVLTHGHEDHIGATPFFLEEFHVPVHGTPFTLGLIQKKLDEYKLPKRPKLHMFKAGETLNIGQFQVDTIFINHSIIDACALAIHTSMGALVHVTDWKIDKSPLKGPTTDLKKFASLGKQGVLAFLCDSTNAARPGSTISEKEVLSKIKKICSKHKGRILITLFSSNMQRVEALAHLAKDLGRSLSFVGRSMHENTQIARQLGQANLDGIHLIDVEQTKHMSPHKVMVLATGTQGEPRSALSRMAHGEFKPFRIQEGDLILFSSKVIPGNEKNIFAVINHLSRHGAKVLYESVHEIHTSGHAHQEEIKTVYKRLKPKYFVPIHGEYYHLVKHADFIESCGLKRSHISIIENGDPLIFSKNGLKRGEPVPVGRVFVDSGSVGEVSDVVVRDRKQLANTGIVMCVLMIDHSKGEIIRGPEIITRGFICEEENKAVLDRAKDTVRAMLDAMNFEARTDLAEIQEEVRLCLRRFFRKEFDRKPAIMPVIYEI